jgi:murein DD-endopeptidase MepM/ murein hydrolase activator NlpD
VGLCIALLAACTEYHAQRLGDTGTWPTATAGGRGVAGPAGAGRHLVLPGETLSELALHYGVPLRRMIEVNRVKKPYHIYVGQVLTVPGRGLPPAGAVIAGTRPDAVVARATTAVAAPRRSTTAAPPVPQPRPAPAEPVQMAAAQVVEVVAARLSPGEEEVTPAQDEATREATRRAASREPPALSGDGFRWPVHGRVLDGFGEKPNGARNDGINIAAADGAPVRAAENGIVVYAGDGIPGFGRMLLVRHAGGFTTAYAHNSALFVGVGDAVERGQMIAHVGSSGAVAGPQLHFEMRLGRKPVDPARHLTQDTQVASN